MSTTEKPSGLLAWLWRHTRPLLAWSDHTRPWGFLVTAALAVGLPALVGAWLGQFPLTITASIGGLVILYMRQTPLAHRMMTLAVCSFGFAASFALGVLFSFAPVVSALTLMLTVVLATVVCRYFAIPAPGTFLFILVACLARTLPFDLSLAAERTGTLLFGCMGACLLAFGYSVMQLYVFKNATPRPLETKSERMSALFLEAMVIGVFVSGGYLLALLIQLEKPYWVPISTAAIMQGATFRAIWHRNVHRIFGTAIGMGLAWAIFSLAPGPWVLAALIMVLSFTIEVLITRNYGLAVIFITPLTVIYADAAIASVDTGHLIMTRMLDIVLGSTIGYVGGWVIHRTRLFYFLEQRLVAWKYR